MNWEKVGEIIKEKKITQEELGAGFGVKKAAINNKISAGGKVRVKDLKILAQLLDIPYDELEKMPDAPKNPQKTKYKAVDTVSEVRESAGEYNYGNKKIRTEMSPHDLKNYIEKGLNNMEIIATANLTLSEANKELASGYTTSVKAIEELITMIREERNPPPPEKK